MHKLKELKIWNKAIDLAVNVYKATELFPNDERFGLTAHIRRTAISVPSNIAEGAGRNGNKEFLQFLGISNGSSYELQTQLVISNRLALITDAAVEPILQQIDELQKMNYSLQSKLSGKL